MDLDAIELYTVSISMNQKIKAIKLCWFELGFIFFFLLFITIFFSFLFRSFPFCFLTLFLSLFEISMVFHDLMLLLLFLFFFITLAM